MYIHHDPDGFVSEVKRHTCAIHERDPWATHPGCTCSVTYSSRVATPEERAQNRSARKAEEERRREHIAAYDQSKSAVAERDGKKG